jgi:hypothetical protein
MLGLVVLAHKLLAIFTRGIEQGAVDRVDGLAVEVVRQSHSVDAGTYVGAQFHYLEVFGHPRMVRHRSGGRTAFK